MADERERHGTGAAGADPEMKKSTRLTLEAAGITLIGVILSIGLTVGFGIEAAIWLKVVAGLATAIGLLAVVKISSAETSALRRAANWITRTKAAR